MATAILKYDISDSDEAMAFLRCVKSTEMAMCLWEIMHNTKKKLAYKLESQDAPESSYDALDMVFERLNEILNDNHIDLEELIV